MRKRVAAKVIHRGAQEGGPEYRDPTIARAASRLWKAMDPRRRGRWHHRGYRRLVPIAIVVATREGAVRPARAP
jgi:hypothetical protein